jgi:hypothetical protein
MYNIQSMINDKSYIYYPLLQKSSVLRELQYSAFQIYLCTNICYLTILLRSCYFPVTILSLCVMSCWFELNLYNENCSD